MTVDRYDPLRPYVPLAKPGVLLQIMPEWNLSLFMVRNIQLKIFRYNFARWCFSNPHSNSQKDNGIPAIKTVFLWITELVNSHSPYSMWLRRGAVIVTSTGGFDILARAGSGESNTTGDPLFPQPKITARFLGFTSGKRCDSMLPPCLQYNSQPQCILRALYIEQFYLSELTLTCFKSDWSELGLGHALTRTVRIATSQFSLPFLDAPYSNPVRIYAAFK